MRTSTCGAGCPAPQGFQPSRTGFAGNTHVDVGGSRWRCPTRIRCRRLIPFSERWRSIQPQTLPDHVADALSGLDENFARFAADQFNQRWAADNSLTPRERALSCLAADVLNQTLGAARRTRGRGGRCPPTNQRRTAAGRRVWNRKSLAGLSCPGWPHGMMRVRLTGSAAACRLDRPRCRDASSASRVSRGSMSSSKPMCSAER